MLSVGDWDWEGLLAEVGVIRGGGGLPGTLTSGPVNCCSR